MPLDLGAGHHCDLPDPSPGLFIDTNGGASASLESMPRGCSRVTKDSLLDQMLLRF